MFKPQGCMTIWSSEAKLGITGTNLKLDLNKFYF